MDQLLTAIYDSEPINKIKELLGYISLESLLQPDGAGLDVLHHAILANNAEVIPLLHQRGFAFAQQGTESPNGSTDSERLCYLHLACLSSNCIVVGELCKLPNCSITSGCNPSIWPEFETIQKYMTKGKGRITTLEKLETVDAILREITGCDDSTISPVDITAMTGNMMCLQTLISVACASKLSLKKLSLLEQTVEVNSLTAFTFVLSKRPSTTEIESAFKHCLSRKLIDFMKVLIDVGVDVTAALNTVNPFHVVYLCSTAFQQSRVRNPVDMSRRNVGLEEVTSFLIDCGFDINSRSPLGTYPLYSLVTALVQEKDNNPTQVPVYHIRTLDLILRAGAQGNFDELLVEDAAHVFSPARDLATSILNCYFFCLQSCDTWRPHIMEHLDRVCLTLLENGGDPNYLDSLGKTPLHDLMRTMASQHAMGHMHADLSTMSRMLLYFGADPNQKSIKGEYPVEYYFKKLMKDMGGLFAFRRWKSSNNASQVLNLLYYMDSPGASVSCQSILANIRGAGEDGMPEDVIDFVICLMNEYTCNPKSLHELSRLAIWRAISRKVQNLKQLRMPKAFVSAIKALFALDI